MAAAPQMASKEIERIEKEDLGFEIPPFDEDEFVRKELISFRTTVFLFFFSLLVALITYGFWRFAWNRRDLHGGEFFLLMAFAMAAGAALPYLYRLIRLDVGHFHKKEWIGTFVLHFFFWMGFTLLLVNPPLGDNAPPVVEHRAMPAVQGLGHNVTFGAYIADNDGLRQSELQFCLLRRDPAPPRIADLPDAERAECLVPWAQVPDHPVWTYAWIPSQEGKYTYYIRAVDTGGQVTERRGSVTIGNPFPVVDPPDGEALKTLSQSVVVRADAALGDLLAVKYEIDGKTYNMTPPSGDRPTYWTTNPTYPGWHRGANNVTFLAEEQPAYFESLKIPGGVARHDLAHRTYTVDTNYPDLNSQTEPKPKERAAPNRGGTPGFEAAFLLVAALGALLVRRTPRHDRP